MKAKKRKKSESLVAFEDLLGLVVQIYYQNDFDLSNFLKKNAKFQKKKRIEKLKKLKVSKENRLVLGNYVLNYLVSPLKSNHTFEDWNIREIAVFECCICYFGL